MRTAQTLYGAMLFAGGAAYLLVRLQSFLSLPKRSVPTVTSDDPEWLSHVPRDPFCWGENECTNPDHAGLHVTPDTQSTEGVSQ